MKKIGEFKKRVKKFRDTEPTPEMLKQIRDKKYLFVRVERTASTSIHETIGGDNRHTKATTYKGLLSKAEWDSFFKFSICRNPYTRFVSAYNAFSREKRNVNDYLKTEGLDNLFRVRLQGFLPQNYYLCEGNKILVDYLGRFEEIDKAWGYISKKLSINKELPHLSQTKNVELTKASKKMIYPFYKEDFELLGYDIK